MQAEHIQEAMMMSQASIRSDLESAKRFEAHGNNSDLYWTHKRELIEMLIDTNERKQDG